MMSPVDLIAGAYVAYGAARGRKRGLSEELFRLVRLGVAFTAGCGLYGLLSGALGRLFSLGGEVAGPVGFVGTMGGSWWLLSRLKRIFTAWVASRWERHQRIGGAIAGGLKASIAALGVVATLLLAGGAPGHDQVKTGSAVGRLAGWVLR